MASVHWPLRHNRPIIEMVLTPTQGGQPVTKTLLADTGAGNAQSSFELLLSGSDCLIYGAATSKMVYLGGAYSGFHDLYLVDVEIPALGFNQPVVAVSVSTVSAGVDGIAGFHFLNRFTYGNFGNPDAFGLET